MFGGEEKEEVKMSLIHEASQELAHSSLDLFTVPPTQTSRINSKYTPYYPVSSISPNGPIEFNVPASDEEYTSLADTELFVRAKIVKLDAETKSKIWIQMNLSDRELVFTFPVHSS